MVDDRFQKSDQQLTLSPSEAKLGVGCLYLAFAALAFVPLSIAALLFYLLYLQPNNRIAAAKSWQETPCEIVHVEFVGNGLDVLYRYEFEGRPHESTRYDLTTGQSGEDDWAREASVRLNKNRSTVCYVNPDDPTEAVLDRDRRHPTVALVLPAIFAAVGLGFLCKLVFGMSKVRAAARQASGDSPADRTSRPHVTTGQRATAKRPSRAAALLAWSAAFGLIAVFFVFMDGIEFARSLTYGDVEWVTVEGTVDWRRDSGTTTMFGNVEEYQIRYQVNGTEHTSRCYSIERPDEYVIEHDTQRPWRGRIVGTTLHATPRILLMIPIGMMLLLLGLLAGCWRVFLPPSK
jgi:hypothetical protein